MMSQVISTILFNGQFWVALIERYEDDRTLFIGKYTFGAEPTNTDLMDFYLNKYQRVKFFKSDEKVRIKKNYSQKELGRNCKKSYENYKIEQKKYLVKKKTLSREKRKESKQEKFLEKAKKKKEKKRGH